MPGSFPDSHSQVHKDTRSQPVSDSVVPKPPAWLNHEAKKIYKNAAKRIVQLGIGGSCDQMLCWAKTMGLPSHFFQVSGEPKPCSARTTPSL